MLGKILLSMAVAGVSSYFCFDVLQVPVLIGSATVGISVYVFSSLIDFLEVGAASKR
jgi:hypothetical protein